MKVALFILLILTIIFGALYKLEVFSSNQIKIKIETANAAKKFKVWLADSEEEKIKGLSGKFRIKDNAGMLFILDENGINDFWMKDMRFKIDLLFIDKNNRMAEIYEQLEPCRADFICPTYSPAEPASYALELKAGRVSKLGVKIGDLMKVED